MEKHTNPILCGGTFLALISQIKKPISGIKKHTDVDVLIGLIRVCVNEYKEPSYVEQDSFKTIVSGYINCKKNRSERLPFTEEKIADDFNNRIKNEYQTSLKAMSDFTNSFIKTDAKSIEWLVRALLELIEKDLNIDNNSEFYVYPDGSPVIKADLNSLFDVCLPSFLLGVWHFIVTKRIDNKLGRETYKNWHKEPEYERTKGKYMGKMGRGYTRSINVSIDIPVDLNIEAVSNDNIQGQTTQNVKESNPPTPNDNAGTATQEKTTATVIQPEATVTLQCILPKKIKFFGRERELEKINEILEEYNYAILTGIQGIGKSTTALMYAYDSLEKYSAIQHIVCENNDSLCDAVKRLEFDGLDKESPDFKKPEFDDIIAMLKNIEKSVLIIFDNLCRQSEQDYSEEFKKLKNCNPYVKFIFTTQTIELLGSNRDKEIFIEPLKKESLLDFYTYYRFGIIKDSNKEYIEKNEDLLIEMFKMVDNHTLAIKLLASLNGKYPNLDENTIKQKLANGFSALSSSNISSVEKDGTHHKGGISEIIKVLFDISKFDGKQKEIMSHMSLMPRGGIKLILFMELTGYEKEEIFTLIKDSWIVFDEWYKKISLHPLIEDVIFNDDNLKPTFYSCNGFFKSVLCSLENLEQKDIWIGLDNIAIHATEKTGLYDSNDTQIIGYVEKLQIALKRLLPIMSKSMRENPIFELLKDEDINALESLFSIFEENNRPAE